MYKRYLISALLLAGLVGSASIPKQEPARAKPHLFTVVVHHDECTECGDIELDSGTIVVPTAMHERYLQAFTNSPRSGPGDYSARYGRVSRYCTTQGWRVHNVKMASDKDFENLFLLSGKKPSNSYGPEDNPWDFNRRYRVTVEVVGIKWSYLTMRVRRAVRLADRKD